MSPVYSTRTVRVLSTVQYTIITVQVLSKHHVLGSTLSTTFDHKKSKGPFRLPSFLNILLKVVIMVIFGKVRVLKNIVSQTY